jgi:hypothetical protein
MSRPSNEVKSERNFFKMSPIVNKPDMRKIRKDAYVHDLDSLPEEPVHTMPTIKGSI